MHADLRVLTGAIRTIIQEIGSRSSDPSTDGFLSGSSPDPADARTDATPGFSRRAQTRPRRNASRIGTSIRGYLRPVGNPAPTRENCVKVTTGKPIFLTGSIC